MQWTKNRWVFMVYRFLMFGYQLAWFLYGVLTDAAIRPADEKPQYLLLSNWTEFLILIYLLIAFLVAIVGVARRHNDRHSNAGKFELFIFSCDVYKIILFCHLYV